MPTPKMLLMRLRPSSMVLPFAFCAPSRAGNRRPEQTSHRSMWSISNYLHSCQSLDGILATRQEGPCTTLVSAGAHNDARRAVQGMAASYRGRASRAELAEGRGAGRIGREGGGGSDSLVRNGICR